MATQEIDRSVWPVFFNDFSKQNEGAMARLETLGADVGDQQTDLMPFGGISFDSKGSEAGSITIMIGTETAAHLEHTVKTPSHVTLKPAGEAGPTVLEIQVEGDSTFLLHLEPALALPEP